MCHLRQPWENSFLCRLCIAGATAGFCGQRPMLHGESGRWGELPAQTLFQDLEFKQILFSIIQIFPSKQMFNITSLWYDNNQLNFPWSQERNEKEPSVSLEYGYRDLPLGSCTVFLPSLKPLAYSSAVWELLTVPLSLLLSWSLQPFCTWIQRWGKQSYCHAWRMHFLCGKAILFHKETALDGMPLKEWAELGTSLLGDPSSLIPTGQWGDGVPGRL